MDSKFSHRNRVRRGAQHYLGTKQPSGQQSTFSVERVSIWQMLVGRPEGAWLLGMAAIGAAVGLLVATVGPLVVFGLGACLAVIWLARLVSDVVVRPRLLLLGLAALTPALVNIPSVVPGSAGKVIVILIFGAAVAVLPRQHQLDAVAVGAVAGYVGLHVLAQLRGAAAGSIPGLSTAISTSLTLILVAAFGFKLFASGDEDDRRQRLLALAIAPAAFVAVNVFVLKFGASIPGIVLRAQEGLAGGQPATMLNSLGFGGATRTSYPMALGVNALGVMAALGVVTGTLAVAAERDNRKIVALFVVAVAVSFYGVLTTDARAPISVAIVIILTALARPRIRSARLALVLPAAPIVLVTALTALGDTPLAQTLSRNGDDFATGTGRTEIWSSIWNDTLQPFAPEHLIGYGANGQLTSGAYSFYRSFFGEERNQLFTAHDVWLQTILDIGYAGLIVLILVLFVAVRRLMSSNSPIAPVIGWATIALVLCGTTEAIPSYQFPECIAVFILWLSADAARRPSGSGPTDHEASDARSTPSDQRAAMAPQVGSRASTASP